jgi:PAS domain S-box-containing protein/putative nucleotidyltransferase with HDIG domain
MPHSPTAPTPETELAALRQRLAELEASLQTLGQHTAELEANLQALRHSEQRYRALAEASQDMIFSIDPNGQITYVNPTAAQQFGLPPEQMLGRHLQELFPSEFSQPQLAALRRVFETQQPLYAEAPTSFGARPVWLGTWLIPLPAEQGSTPAVMGIARDITAHRRAEKVQAALYRISEAAHQASNLAELYGLIHEIIATLMPAQNFYIAIYDAAEQVITFPYHVDELDADWPDQRADQGLTAYVLRTGQPILVTPEKFVTLEAAGEVALIGTRPVDWLGVPLKSQTATIGVMAVQTYIPAQRLAEEDKEVLRFISTQVAMAIERKQAETALAESEARYRQLVEMSPDAIAVHQDGRLVFVNPAAVALMGAQQPADLLGLSAVEIVHPDYRPIVMKRIRHTSNQGEAQPSLEEQFLRLDGSAVDVEVANTPVSYQGRPAVQVIARDITQRKQQAEKLRQANLELARAYNATLEGWSRALELRERETAGHSLRVVDLTVQLAETLGIDNETQQHIRRGALLHDIGKMGIPDNILLKPGPLTEDEWIIMRQHPIYSYEMLKDIPYLHPALDIPYYHHERWNGSGYPLGLKDAHIPLAARVFAVIDSWDALTSDRPYRPAWPAGEVKTYLQTQSGKLFDPLVIEAFLTLIP